MSEQVEWKAVNLGLVVPSHRFCFQKQETELEKSKTEREAATFLKFRRVDLWCFRDRRDQRKERERGQQFLYNICTINIK